MHIFPSGSDTVVLLVQYTANTSRGAIDVTLKSAHRNLQKIADSEGYKWLKIEDRLHLLSL